MIQIYIAPDLSRFPEISMIIYTFTDTCLYQINSEWALSDASRFLYFKRMEPQDPSPGPSSPKEEMNVDAADLQMKKQSFFLQHYDL